MRHRQTNISEACRVFDISRTTFYEWKTKAERYGLDAVWTRVLRQEFGCPTANQSPGSARVSAGLRA